MYTGGISSLGSGLVTRPRWSVRQVVADGLDPARLDGLVHIGVDEVSWKRHHHYLTLVCDHSAKKVIWGAAGKDATRSTRSSGSWAPGGPPRCRRSAAT